MVAHRVGKWNVGICWDVFRVLASSVCQSAVNKASDSSQPMSPGQCCFEASLDIGPRARPKRVLLREDLADEFPQMRNLVDVLLPAEAINWRKRPWEARAYHTRRILKNIAEFCGPFQ